MGPEFVHTHGLARTRCRAGRDGSTGSRRQGRVRPAAFRMVRRAGKGAEQRAGWVLTVLASMQLVHGGEVGDDIELDSEGVHLQRELACCLCQLRVGNLAERVRGAPKPDV